MMGPSRNLRLPPVNVFTRSFHSFDIGNRTLQSRDSHSIGTEAANSA
uniref:Uncharacterized protein n=1 Tax=Rhizophora mucronata TaxID=61149 RepID=A0A2P2PDX6_RHIMU